MTFTGSLVGPGSTVNAEILQLYSVNGVSIVIVTVVPLTSIYVHKIQVVNLICCNTI